MLLIKIFTINEQSIALEAETLKTARSVKGTIAAESSDRLPPLPAKASSKIEKSKH
jgi:hypothetical protein